MADSLPSDAPAPDAPDLRLQRHEPLRLRAWFVPFFLLLAIVGVVALVSGQGTTTGHLAMLFAYMSVACTFLPLPTLWIVVWASAGGLGLPPLAVATVGALGTAAANMHDYYLLTFLYRYRPVRQVRTTAWYRKVAAWYNRAPLATLAAASCLPIPVDVVRLLAISEGYHRGKFVLGTLAGRWPRYLLFAVLAERFSLGWQWVVGLLAATVLLGLWRGLPPVVRKVRGAWRGRREKKETSA
jgi:membrane protein YqaA with SNARE-associated domain